MNDKLKFSEDHIWVKVERDSATLGLSGYAQEELGDIVSIELPSVDDRINKGEPFGEIESVKTATELVAPVTGKVLDVNVDLKDIPSLINEDPYGDGWLLQVVIEEPSELDSLLTQDEYEKHTEKGK